MRKLFLLIPALVFAIMASATRQTISPSSEESDSNIRSALSGTADTIILNAGNYKEADQIHFRRNAVIMAADGAEVIITPKYYCDFVYENTKVKIIGIKFNGSISGQQAIRVYDANAGKELRLENCEFYNFAKDVISGDKSEYTMDSCIINNCYFHNNNYSPIYFNKSSVEGKQTIYGLIVKNSTFANNNPSLEYRSVIDVQSYNRAATDEIEVVVDHCTFYNNTTINYDYSAVRTRIVNRTTVSNCIFAHPEAIEFYATNVWAGNVTNCLAYNFNKGYMSGPTRTNANTGDPLFNDLANNNYTYDGDWVTPSISPARAAATDGSDLGDPRWYSDEILPSSNFVAPYAFVGAKAQIAGNLWYDGTNEYLYYNDKSVCGTAKWKIHATRACAVKATLNMTDGSSSGHIFRIELLDANGNQVAEIAESYNEHDGDIDLPNPLAIPAEGDYTVILHNDQSWSSAKINSITFAYIGGAIVTVPAEELVGAEAVLVNNGSLKVSKQENGDLKYGDNGTPLGEYVYWNINATKRGDMKVTLNVVPPTSGSASTHNFLVELYSDLSGEPIASAAEVAATSGTGARVLANSINIPAVGNYIVKLTNQTQWSSAILHSIEFEYLGGATMNVPADELIGEEAVLVDEGHLKVSKLANGDLKYGDNGYPLDEYVYWNINATKYGRMDVTLNVVAPGEGNPSGHQFLVELYSDLSGEAIVSTAEAASTSATGAIALPAINIPAIGNYIVKLTNQKQWSSAILHSIELAYAGGEVANVPGQILGVDAMLLKEDGGTLKMYHDENGDITYNDNSYNMTEYALWNINATEAAEMIVTLNVATAGHIFSMELYQGNTRLDSIGEAEATKWDDGDIVLADHLNFPAAGAYTLKLLNNQQYSHGALHGITFEEVVAPAAVVLDEMDEDNSAWIGYKDGDPVNVTLNRTLKAGMYNTFCLPFAVSSTQCKAVFGNDVEIYTLGSAVVEGTVLNVTLDPSDDIYQGTPVFIKPSADVVNPSFEGVSIVKETPASTTKTNANLVGTFVKTTLTGGENILYLGPSNTLYYPEIDTPIKGMRAWFAIHDAPTPAPAIKRMNIVNAPAVVTEINLIDADNKAVKIIENGQLIITIDGVRYNVMGTKIQ